MNIRDQFPLLKTQIGSKQLVYLDNAATTQKPQSVIDALVAYYTHSNSNIHRGAHFLANKSTEEYEATRDIVASFIGAKSIEINFTKGTTESINLLMNSWGRKFLSTGDEILLTEMEHHANIVPWLSLKESLGIVVKYIPFTEEGILDISTLDSLITPKTKLVSMAMISNALGTIHPIEIIIEKAKKVGALVHLDAAQAIAHQKIDVNSLGVDFMSFSSHKMYGPMGAGIFWGKEALLNEMNPFLYGGEMIKEVYLDSVTYNDLPFKFEAGTPNVGDIIAFKNAISFVNDIGFEHISEIESSLYQYLYSEMSKLEGVKIYSPKGQSIGALSFNLMNAHPYDVGQLLDAQGIAIRTGHHCCQPLMRKLGIEGTCRVSLAVYNSKEEIDFFIEKLKKISTILG